MSFIEKSLARDRGLDYAIARNGTDAHANDKPLLEPGGLLLFGGRLERFAPGPGLNLGRLERIDVVAVETLHHRRRSAVRPQKQEHGLATTGTRFAQRVGHAAVPTSL